MDILYLDFVKPLTLFPTAILMEKLAAHGLYRCNLYLVKNWFGGLAQRLELNSSGSCSLVGFPKAQYQGQLCVVSLLLSWMRGLSAPSAISQSTSSSVGVLICSKAGSP